MLKTKSSKHFHPLFNGIASLPRQTPEDIFGMTISQTKFIPTSWFDEAVRVAKHCVEISKKEGKELVIFFSGGKDSEVILHLLKKINAKFRVVIIKLNEEINKIEFDQGVKSLNSLEIPFETLDFDFGKFVLNGKMEEMLKEEYSSMPEFLYLFHIIKSFFKDSFVVLGNIGFQLRKDGYYRYRELNTYPETSWSVSIPEANQCLNFLFKKYNISGVPSFFSHTPEIMLAYLRDPLTRLLLDDKLIGCWHSHFSFSEKFYKKFFPEMEERKKVGTSVGKNFKYVIEYLKIIQNNPDLNYNGMERLLCSPDELIQFLSRDSKEINFERVLAKGKTDLRDLAVSKWSIYREYS